MLQAHIGRACNDLRMEAGCAGLAPQHPNPVLQARLGRARDDLRVKARRAGIAP